jgi:hypothetical protein
MYREFKFYAQASRRGALRFVTEADVAVAALNHFAPHNSIEVRLRRLAHVREFGLGDERFRLRVLGLQGASDVVVDSTDVVVPPPAPTPRPAPPAPSGDLQFDYLTDLMSTSFGKGTASSEIEAVADAGCQEDAPSVPTCPEHGVVICPPLVGDQVQVGPETLCKSTRKSCELYKLVSLSNLVGLLRGLQRFRRTHTISSRNLWRAGGVMTVSGVHIAKPCSEHKFNARPSRDCKDGL